jgi:hypothetical protein
MLHAQHRRRLELGHDHRKLLAGRRKLFHTLLDEVCWLHERLQTLIDQACQEAQLAAG